MLCSLHPRSENRFRLRTQISPSAKFFSFFFAILLPLVFHLRAFNLYSRSKAIFPGISRDVTTEKLQSFPSRELIFEHESAEGKTSGGSGIKLWRQRVWHRQISLTTRKFLVNDRRLSLPVFCFWVCRTRCLWVGKFSSLINDDVGAALISGCAIFLENLTKRKI